MVVLFPAGACIRSRRQRKMQNYVSKKYHVYNLIQI